MLDILVSTRKEGEFMNSLQSKEEGFTGLEAAIVLIAFVVVAAVFSYVVLGAGFFTTQKAQETVHTSVSQASSAMELSGPVTLTTDGSSAPDYIDFYLQLAAGGTSVDLSKVTYTLSTPSAVVTYVDVNAASGTPKVARSYVMGTGTNLLEPRQMVLVTIGIGGANEFTAANLGVNTKFIIEVKPSGGASLPIGRSTPAAYAVSKSYEVF